MAATQAGPMETIMRNKLSAALTPSTLEIYNDSHKHAHHVAMQDSTSKETHFRVNIVSESFKDKMRVARHRLVYAILGDELDAPGGIHALQLNTKTPSEAGLSSDHIITSPDTAAPSSSTSDTVAAVAQS